MPVEDLSELPERCFRAPVAGAVWHQFDIGLQRSGVGARAHARVLFGRILPELDAALIQRRIRGWYFMRKPPDIRLRLEFLSGEAQLLATIDSLLGELRDVEVLSAHARGRYQPESLRFGGAQAMAWVHAWCCLDSRLWAELDQQHADSGGFLPQVFRHLFALCDSDAGAVWRRLAALIGEAAEPAGVTARPPAPSLSPWQGELLGLYREANRRFVEALYVLENRRGLLRQPAEIAAELALFSFNRHGFSGAQSGPLVAQSMARLVSPQA